MEYDYRCRILQDVLEEVQDYINENNILKYRCIEFYDVFNKELFHIEDGKYYWDKYEYAEVGLDGKKLFEYMEETDRNKIELIYSCNIRGYDGNYSVLV